MKNRKVQGSKVTYYRPLVSSWRNRLVFALSFSAVTSTGNADLR